MSSSVATPTPASNTRRTKAFRVLIPAEPRFLLLVAGAVSVLMVAALAIWSIIAGQRDEAASYRASTVRDLGRRLVADLHSLETGQRGYLLTEDQAYLTGWQDTRADAMRVLDELRAQAPLSLLPAVATLDEPVRARLALLTEGLQHAQAGDREAALAVVRSGAGQREMVRSLAVLEDIIAGLTAIRASHDDRRREAYRNTVTVIVVGSAVAALALLVGITFLRRRTLERARAIAEIQQQSTEIERRRVALSQALGQLAMVNQALAHSNRDLDQFAYVASHDLKAPLRGIASLASWIEEDLGERLDEEIAGHLRLLRSRVERLELLIEGILAYSRAGRGCTPAAAVDTRSLVGRVVELIAPPEDLEIVVAPDVWPTLSTVAVQLEQVWMNLIGNAIKYGHRPGEPPRVTLRSLGPEDGSAWHFAVVDDGPGIPAEFQERIFGMFQRLQSRDEVEGAGIGLAIVRKLVTAHGGKVWAESPVTGGTTMHFTWGTRT